MKPKLEVTTTELRMSFSEMGSQLEDYYKYLNKLKQAIGYWSSRSLNKDEIMLLINICTQQKDKYDIKDSEINLIDNFKCYGREYVHLDLIVRFNNGVEFNFFMNYNPNFFKNLKGDLSELIFILKAYEFFSEKCVDKYIDPLIKYIEKEPTEKQIDKIKYDVIGEYVRLRDRDYMESRISRMDKQKCYILIDTKTGFIKIGCSMNPLKREKTLQSEKPTIKMIHFFKHNHESVLHNKYKDNRVRGEWFDISEDEVQNIINSYE